ncbi:MAG: hypothetical protein GX601_16775 [Anaerolineales bacterium]|jgi:hypothetical protein|nr:hypothetical protein [Anaerolineales bacterium]
MKYPKIETLWDRDPKTFKVLPWHYRLPEFKLVSNWLVTEKIDGTNVRIMLHADGSVEYGGRTDNAQMPATLLARLNEMFTTDRMRAAFEQNEDGAWPEVTVFGEGYGPKIQNGGSYRADANVRIFDVVVGQWWLNWDDVEDVANKLGVLTVPVVTSIDWLPICAGDLEGILSFSHVALYEAANDHLQPEGIVCRTDPLLFTRRGDRVMWKLKYKDFE